MNISTKLLLVHLHVKHTIMTAVGRIVLTAGTLIFLHAAYSTYEHLTLRKSLGLVGLEAQKMPIDITIETLVSFVIILLGVSMTATPLKQVTWASEMRKK